MNPQDIKPPVTDDANAQSSVNPPPETSFVQEEPKLRREDYVPSNWDIKPHECGEDGIVRASNNITGLTYEGPVKGLSKLWSK